MTAGCGGGGGYERGGVVGSFLSPAFGMVIIKIISAPSHILLIWIEGFHGQHVIFEGTLSRVKKKIIACWGEVEMQISKIRDSLSKQSLSQVKCPVNSRIQTLSGIWKYWILGASGSGVWKVTLDAQDAGGPYTINASSKVGNITSSISLADVLFGDVWLCSGQSNMAFTVTQVQICTCKLLSMYGTHSTVCN